MADEPTKPRADESDGDPPEPGSDDQRGDREEERPRRTAPLADLADRVRQRRAGEEAVRGSAPANADADAPAADRFVHPDAFDPDAVDRLWQALGESSTAAAAPEEPPDEDVVSKRAYCESCEHLGEPPVVRCTHPGTTIVSFPDADHVRVRDCPVVAERRATGEAREAGRRSGPGGRGRGGSPSHGSDELR